MINTVYVIDLCDFYRCQNFLLNFMSLPVSVIMWPQLWSKNVMAHVGHLVENIVCMEIPSAFYILQVKAYIFV